MAEVKLIVLYPFPADIDRFNRDYENHLKLLHRKMQIPEQARPYTVTRFVEMPQGRPNYYLMFALPFPSAEALQQAFSTQEMQEVAADAARLSSGGAPVILMGVDGV
jgi:uncharacterized protein (TIGR02118 family)